MLVNDSVTVAVEIPIYLTATDLAYYRHHGFDLDFDAEVVTGHIDFLQIRNSRLHILDYKPEARKETHAHVQLTIYALALARRTGLPLKFFSPFSSSGTPTDQTKFRLPLPATGDPKREV